MRFGARVGLLVAALTLALPSGFVAADEREDALAWLEHAIEQEADVQAAFMAVAFEGHSGDAPVADPGERAYYESMPIRFESDPDEWDRGDAVAGLEQQMAASSLRSLEVHLDGGSVAFDRPFGGARFDALPIPVLAIATAVASPDHRGVETDVVARGSRSQHWMTARHELDGRLVLRVTENVPADPAPAPDSAELSARFGIGPLVDGDVAWSPGERASLARALALVPARDLEVIAGMPFARDKEAPPELEAAAYYDQIARLVRCFDATFEHDGGLFLGEPDAPHDYSVRVIVHEIAHAVAYDKPYQAIQGFVARAESMRLLYDQLGQLSIGGLPSERERLIRILERLNDVTRPLGRFRQAAAGETLHASPVHTRYVELAGGYGPTPYGREKLSEAFAEAYALFLLDPAALARVDPAALAFFRSGAYQLDSLHVAPVPEVPDFVRDYLAIPEDAELEDELDAMLEAEIGPLD